MGELVALLVLLAVGGIIRLLMGPTPGEQLIDTNKGDVISLNDLTNISTLGNNAVHAVLVRQSGNIYRDLGTFVSAEAALAEIAKSFRRAKVDEVRVTHADENAIAVYRCVYSDIGRAEGKKLGGARIVRVGEDRERWLTV
ncbi:hypothetical protein SAMN05421665_0110 [Yoonia rosea]|uniref:Uncharacterized protein n=1 Tax=Yoonia rosea TaxID=287098 RepID=A0A1R3WEH2_9RHOB|nr:hypothetical protein [Yoonia rosea]SIT74818.1 hypothetical protein SAMN05421665_0110 [Yoonia rosea]